MKINKVKHEEKDGVMETFIDYELPNKNGDMSNYTLKTTDLPKKSFVAVFRSLEKSICTICDFDLADEKYITVTGVTFTHKKSRVSFVITAEKELDICGDLLKINTPKLSDAQVDEDTKHSLDLLVDECKEFILGNRMAVQLNLFGDGSEAVEVENENFFVHESSDGGEIRMKVEA